MRTLLFVCVGILAAFVAPLSVQAQSSGIEPVLLDQQAERGIILRQDNMRVLVTDEELDWQALRERHDSADWRVPRADVIGEQAAAGEMVWIRIGLANPSTVPGEWLLELRSFMLEGVTGYWSTPEGLQRLNPRDADSLNSLLPLELEGGQSRELLLRVSDTEYLFMPMAVWTPAGYEAHNNSRLLIFGMAFGIFLVMILYNSSLYIFTRDVMYLVYSNSVFSILLYVLAITGYGELYLWQGNRWLLDNAYSLFVAYCFLSVTYFFRVFLNLPHYGSWMLQANNAFMVIWTLVLVGVLTGYQDAAMAVVAPVGVLVTLVGTVTAGYLWWLGNRNALYFLIAWSVVSISTVVIINVVLGIMRYFPAVDYFQTFGFVVEVTLLSVALAERINRDRLARESAQREANDHQRELLSVKQRINEELEERVRQRTADFEKALDDLAKANIQLERLSEVDSLTQMYNRRYFDRIVQHELARAARQQSVLSLILVDIDHFKDINDTHGHVAGDKCLQLVAQCLTQQLSRATDVVARYGGEEFAVVLPDTLEADARRLAERIRQAIQELALIYEGRTIRLTASFGVAGLKVGDRDTVDSLVDVADKALYQAKEKGRNRVEVSIGYGSVHHKQ